MNAKDLELKIAGLEKAIQEKTTDASRFKDELEITKKQLADVNKPELTTSQAEAIEKAVEKAVERFDFTDTDNFEIDYSLDYDGKVQCESHEFNNSYSLVDEIVTEVCNLFKEVEDEKTDD